MTWILCPLNPLEPSHQILHELPRLLLRDPVPTTLDLLKLNILIELPTHFLRRLFVRETAIAPKTQTPHLALPTALYPRHIVLAILLKRAVDVQPRSQCSWSSERVAVHIEIVSRYCVRVLSLTIVEVLEVEFLAASDEGFGEVWDSVEGEVPEQEGILHGVVEGSSWQRAFAPAEAGDGAGELLGVGVSDHAAWDVVRQFVLAMYDTATYQYHVLRDVSSL